MTELQRLREAFRTALELPADAPVDELRYQDDEKWDSLAHMSSGGGDGRRILGND